MNSSASQSINVSSLIDLKSQWTQQAIDVANNSHNSTRKFDIYIQSLAVYAFESWLSQKNLDLIFDSNEISSFQPELANFLDVVCNFKFGNFQFCLIPILNADDLEVRIPRYALHIPEFMAHFYILVEIDEELEIAIIKGFMGHENLVGTQDNYKLEKDWNYVIPLSSFELDSEKLLVCLQSNTNAAIATPLGTVEIPLPKVERNSSLVNISTELKEILPKVKEQPLWKNLTWSQAAKVVSNPYLRSWLYRAIADKNSTCDEYLSDLLNMLTKKAVNLWDWIQIQQEYIESELKWQIIPTNKLTVAFRDTESCDRSTTSDLNNILEQASDSFQINIPQNAAKAYQEFALENPFRLYAVTWINSEIERSWSLLIILTSIPKNIPPYGVKLRVSDLNDIVQQQELNSNIGGASLCTYIQATTKDKLCVVITPPENQQEITRVFEFKF